MVGVGGERGADVMGWLRLSGVTCPTWLGWMFRGQRRMRLDGDRLFFRLFFDCVQAATKTCKRERSEKA